MTSVTCQHKYKVNQGQNSVCLISDILYVLLATFLPQVRNSSTLLFSALVARIFGAKRVSDEHSMENKLTAKEFFTRFPSLHGFLLEELTTASQMLERQSGK